MSDEEESRGGQHRGILRDGRLIRPVKSRYSPSQACQWLSSIRFQPVYTEKDIASGNFAADLKNLHALMYQHLVTFPFENTSMHYTSAHAMDVTHGGLFQRFVVEGKGGSYCFGQNTLFLEMLRALGYRAYGGAARVGKGPTGFSPLHHMMIFVQPIAESNETYVVDVGFGGPNLCQPILLSQSKDNVVWGSSPPERHRLTLGVHPASSLVIDKADLPESSFNVHWQLEVTHESEDAAWNILYAFSEDEFFVTDVDAASFNVSERPTSDGIFWNDVIAVGRFVLDDEQSSIADQQANTAVQDGMIVKPTKVLGSKATWQGKHTMSKGVVKRQVGKKSEVIWTSQEEGERIRALHDIFGVAVDVGDAKYIKGRDSALPLT